MAATTVNLTGTMTATWTHSSPPFPIYAAITANSNTSFTISVTSSGPTGSSYFYSRFFVSDSGGTTRWTSSIGTSPQGEVDGNVYLYHEYAFNGGTWSQNSSYDTTISRTITLSYGSTFTLWMHCQSSDACEDANNNPDATIHNSGNSVYPIFIITNNTYNPPTCSGNASVTAISGTTVTVRVPSWTNGTDSATATIVCSNYSSGTTIDTKAITSSSGGTVTFTELENGVRYRFRVTISDGTTSLSITASDGNSPNARTYACAVTDIDTSTCRIQFTAKPTAGSIQGSYVYESATITYTITGSTTATGTTSAGGSTLILNGFTHNTTHTISIYITGVTDTNGNYDATDSDSAVTKTLLLTGEVGECTMTTIETSWQALVDGSAQNADNLSGDYYTFCTSSTSSHNHYPACETTNGSGYIKSEITPTCTVPTYSSSKIIVFENLTYYCQYIMTVYITDGTNCVSYSLTAETIYPYARIYYNGAWYKAFVYVYDGGWNLSVGNVYDGSWRIFNGVST